MSESEKPRDGDKHIESKEASQVELATFDGPTILDQLASQANQTSPIGSKTFDSSHLEESHKHESSYESKKPSAFKKQSEQIASNEKIKDYNEKTEWLAHMSSFTSQEDVPDGINTISPSRKTVIKTYQKTLKRDLMNSFFETQKTT